MPGRRSRSGGGPDETTSYAYATDKTSDGSLWRHDTNETVQLAYRTWSSWAGYSKVATTHGAAGGPQTVTSAVYDRGMDGEAKANTDGQTINWTGRRAGLLTPLLPAVGTPGTTGGSPGRVDVVWTSPVRR
jgi:hypothetical protein